MKVRVIRPFRSFKYGAFSKGKIVDLPDDVDWIKAGFVVAIETEAPESAMMESAPEKAIKPKPKPRKRTAQKKKKS